MKIDTEYLRQHYASLSDDALAALNRDELVEAAQACFDQECARRGLVPGGRQQRKRRESQPAHDETASDAGLTAELSEDEEPDWLESAACVASFAEDPANHRSPEAVHAQEVLREAGIPSYVAVEEIPSETASQRSVIEYRVLVPGALNLKAASILDERIFNEQIEDDWKAHFANLSDEELAQLTPEVICAGLRDRIDRLTRVYEEEIARRLGG
jgi:hypothetical protein